MCMPNPPSHAIYTNAIYMHCDLIHPLHKEYTFKKLSRILA